MYQEKHPSSPKPSENTQAANETHYFEDALASLSVEQLQERRKALAWLTNEANGQSAAQRVQYQTELDHINSILAQ
jgi:hypothetical protein